jgi:hypothetical protein
MTRLVCLLCLLLSLPGTVYAQLRPALATPPDPDAVLAGTVSLRVIARADLDRARPVPGIVGKRGVVAEARLDNVVLATFDRLPYELVIDTTAVSDGAHTLSLHVVDPTVDRAGLAERWELTVRNAPLRGPLAARSSPRRTVIARPIRILPAAIRSVTDLRPTISVSANPLSAPATALARGQDRLCIGLPDGGIALCDLAHPEKSGTAIRLPAPTGAVRLAAIGKGSIWWIAGATETLYRFVEKTGVLQAFDLADDEGGPGWIRRLAARDDGSVVLVGDGFDGRRLVPEAGTLAALAPDEMDRIREVLDPAGTATVFAGGVRAQPRGRDEIAPILFGTHQTLEIPLSPQIAVLGISGLWIADDTRVVHVRPDAGTASAYLPWNGARGKIRDILVDETGAYLATEKGVRRIVPGRPRPETGYDGFVRVRLGSDTMEPRSPVEQKLAALIEEWQGVPYLWGGQTKKGTDCSGFVGSVCRACGMDLPRTSQAMGQSNNGKRIVDELRFGDVLVYPGHVALYIGNGRTAETVGTTQTGGSVSKSAIWGRTTVIVRRFGRN